MSKLSSTKKKKTGHLKLGSILGEFFRGILRKNPRLHKLLVSLGSGDVPEDEQNEARIELEDLVLPIRQKLSKILLCTHSGPVNNDECDTDIRAELLRRWATVARDPGVGVCNWLTRGANAGLSADPEGIDGIFPLADTELEEFEADECISTQSAESLDNDSMEQIEGYAKKGWLEETSRQELIQEFGSDFTVSRFCVISQEKQGKIKQRLILDLKKSGISRRTRKTHRVILPRLSDLVQDLLSMIGKQSAEHDTEVFVLDFTDAFWQIPLASCERRHFIGTYGHKLWKFKRAAQGSRNGPLSWASPSSLLLLRCTQERVHRHVGRHQEPVSESPTLRRRSCHCHIWDARI